MSHPVAKAAEKFWDTFLSSGLGLENHRWPLKTMSSTGQDDNLKTVFSANFIRQTFAEVAGL
jgi:hypothetical protein